MNIKYEQEPGGTCPVQAEGRVNGLPFYFCSRGGYWSLSIAKAPNGDPLDCDQCLVYHEAYDGIHRDEPREFNGDMVQFGAGYAEPEECRAFIERAAGLLLPNAAMSHERSELAP